MICVGVDPGANGFHAAVLHGTDLWIARSCVPGKKQTFTLRSGVLGYTHTSAAQLMVDILSQFPGEEIAVFCEEPLVAGARNLRTSLMIAQAVGALVAAVDLYTPKCYLVPVSTWKQHTVGKGNASKTEVADWLRRVHPDYAAHCVGSQDRTDACALACYGLGVLADASLVSSLGSSGEL